MPRFAFLLCLSIAFVCCQEQKPPAQPAAEQPAAVQPAPAAATLPSLPLETLQRIHNEGTQVDYIFYNYPFTLSLAEKPAIQHSVRHVAAQAAPLKAECQPAGRVTFQINGNIVLEADFYFSTGCTYFVFMENQQKKYANFMTDEGINYFNGQIQQAMKMAKQAQGQ